MKTFLIGLVGLASAAIAPAAAHAATIIVTLPEYNGVPGNLGATPIGTFNFSLAPGEVVTGATFTSVFGNTVVDSSATGFLLLDGVTVGTCPSSGPCYNTPLAINYTFLPSQLGIFADGSASLVYNQTDCCVIRLSPSTLTLTTGIAGVPEPGTWALMLLGFGGMGLAMRRRRTQALAAA